MIQYYKILSFEKLDELIIILYNLCGSRGSNENVK